MTPISIQLWQEILQENNYLPLMDCLLFFRAIALLYNCLPAPAILMCNFNFRPSWRGTAQNPVDCAHEVLPRPRELPPSLNVGTNITTANAGNEKVTVRKAATTEHTCTETVNLHVICAKSESVHKGTESRKV